MSAQLFSVEERGAVFNLEDFTEENFDIRSIVNRVMNSVSPILPDQIEVLTNLHEGEEVSDVARNIKQFHPEPFLFMIENQIDSLNALRVKSQTRLAQHETSARRYELEHQQRLQQLNNTVDGVLANFHKLEKRVNKIVHIAMSAGQSIESSSQAQDQARFAQFVIRCFLDLNTGDLSRVDPILTSHDERRIIEAGQLIQLLQNISDELNTKNSRRPKPLRHHAHLVGIDEENDGLDEDEDDGSDDDGGGDRLFTKRRAATAAAAPVTTTLEGGGSQTVTVLTEGDTQTTTTTTTTPDGVTTTVVETVQTTTLNTHKLDFSRHQRTNADTFLVAAKTIQYLSERIENKLIEKFRVCTLHKDYAAAFKYAEVLYTFKDSHYNPPRGSDPTFVSAFYGKKFLYYSYDVLSAMRIPKQVERKDLSSARVFTIWFTRVITTIIDVLRDQCEILPMIAPNATQTFEDIVLAVFQCFLPRLIQQVIEHPSLAASDLKSLRTRATMIDLSRRAICEVLCMIEDVSKAVEKRNVERRHIARFSNDNVKSKQSTQGGLLYQLGTYQQQLQSTELGNAIEDTNTNSNAALQQSLYTLFNAQEGITEVDNSKSKSLVKNNSEHPAFMYGYLAAAMQSMATEAANDSGTEKKPFKFSSPSTTTAPLSKFSKSSKLSSSSSISVSKDSTTTTTSTMGNSVASILDKVQPKTLSEIDYCFTAELPPISAMLRENITTSLNSFAEGWFDKEYNYLRASLKQIRDDLLLSKFNTETLVNKKIETTRSIFTIPKETLVDVKETRRQWLQETIMDTEPIDFLFRSLTGAIKRAQIISPPSKRPEHVDALFLLVAEFMYSQYLYPMASEAIIRYSAWGPQLLRWNRDYFYNHPTQINHDIPLVYSLDAHLKRQRELAAANEGGMGGNGPVANAQPPPPAAAPQPRIKNFYDMNIMQQEFQLHSILPTMGTREMDYIRSYILEGSKVQVSDLNKVSNTLLKNPFSSDKGSEDPSGSGGGGGGADRVPSPKEEKEKSALELSHDEIMYDLIFVLTILKSCIDIDKRLSAYLTRAVFPHLSSNLTLRSLAQVRLDNTRSNLENKIRQYLSCYAIYVSYGFDSILKLIPYSHYKLKSVETVSTSTTKVTALWIQASQLVESTAAAVIASLSGLNVDDFLQYFIQQVIERLLVRITHCGGVSQLGAPLLLQDLAHIQRPVNTIGIPHLIMKMQELRNISFLFFSPYNGIRTFLAERLGVMHIDVELVKTLVQARADYSTYKSQLQQQLQTFMTSLDAQNSQGSGPSTQK